jgi:transposase
MAMTIVETSRSITGGVDTHLDVHVAAAVDAAGGVLGVESFATTAAGFARLHEWLSSFGPVRRVGVEGTGAYGAGLARYLRGQHLEVVEVDRPNRQQRRRAGKSDTVDAIEAARAALSGRASGIAKTADGNAEAIRALLIAKRSARDTRIMCLNQIRHLGFTAPDALRERFRACRVGASHTPQLRCGQPPAATWSRTQPSSHCRPSVAASSISTRRPNVSTNSSPRSCVRPRRPARSRGCRSRHGRDLVGRRR